MGKGDVKSRKGKINKGTFGVKRRHKPKVTIEAKKSTKS